MADGDEADNTSARKPPISPRPKEVGDEPAVKPVKKKKKKKPTDSQEETTKDRVVGDAPKPRRPRSQSSSRDTNENSKLETNATVTTPKKKKRKPKTDNTTDDHVNTDRTAEDVSGSKASLLTNGTATTTPRKKKGKKKKKIKSSVQHADDEFIDNILAADLECIGEDIVKGSEVKDEPLPLANLQHQSNLRSEPTSKMYIEITSGFKKENKAKHAKRLAEEQVENVILPEPQRKTTIDFALSAHRILKIIFLFIHGLTAGIAVWQVVVVYVLSNHSDLDFLQHYQPLALPVHCMFYLLLVMCTVSACDRWDIGNVNWKFFLSAITLQNGAVSILVYLAAIILSVSVVSSEDRMHLYYTNEDFWTDPNERYTELSNWRAINTARGALAVLGWVILSITPNADRLKKSLQEGDDNDVLLGNEVQFSNPA